MMVCMAYRVKQNIWMSFRSMKQDLTSFGLRLKSWLWKSKREDDEMSRGYRMIYTYCATKRNHKEIRSHKLAAQGNPHKR